MAKVSVRITIGWLALLVGGCASQTGWTPTVDQYNDPNAARIQTDLMECQQLTQQAASGPGMEAAESGLLGGLLGAATGAVVRAITGNPASGAAIGAVTGGVGGATRQGLTGNDAYKRIYSNCMRNRGHNVLD